MSTQNEKQRNDNQKKTGSQGAAKKSDTKNTGNNKNDKNDNSRRK